MRWRRAARKIVRVDIRMLIHCANKLQIKRVRERDETGRSRYAWIKGEERRRILDESLEDPYLYCQ